MPKRASSRTSIGSVLARKGPATRACQRSRKGPGAERSSDPGLNEPAGRWFLPVGSLIEASRGSPQETLHLTQPSVARP